MKTILPETLLLLSEPAKISRDVQVIGYEFRTKQPVLSMRGGEPVCLDDFIDADRDNLTFAQEAAAWAAVEDLNG